MALSVRFDDSECYNNFCYVFIRDENMPIISEILVQSM